MRLLKVENGRLIAARDRDHTKVDEVVLECTQLRRDKAGLEERVKSLTQRLAEQPVTQEMSNGSHTEDAVQTLEKSVARTTELRTQ